jgi:hypothetical protein
VNQVRVLIWQIAGHVPWRVARPVDSLAYEVDLLRTLALNAIAERDAAIVERDRLIELNDRLRRVLRQGAGLRSEKRAVAKLGSRPLSHLRQTGRR